MSRSSTRLALALLVGGAVAAACSSAPAPAALDQGPSGTTGTSATGTTGSTPAAGTTGGSTGGSAGTTGGTTGAVGTSGATTGTTGTSGSTGTSGATGGTSGTTTGGAPGGTHLFTDSENRIGITPTSLRICAHAALIYAKAFKTDVKDLNVFWDALNAEKGGIYGRRVDMSYEDDQYKPDVAVQAAKTCVAKNIFMLLGGIGFDQIPAVRNYVEQAHVLYVYHTATVKGSKGLKYSFTELPTVERLGAGFAQLARQKFMGKRIGILKRDSTNWEPGIDAFRALGKVYGLNIVAEEKAAASAGSYASQIQNLKNAKADVVFIWLNALETFEAAKQMHTAQFNPNIMAFPFNLTSQTLLAESVNPVMEGVAMYPAYSKGDYSGPFASYADDMKEFERQYATYDAGPNGPDLSGVAGDLLFLNWVGQKALYRQLLMCGKDCTRNRFVDVLQGYHGVPSSSACPIDFREGDRHHGAEDVTFMETYRAPDGHYNWRETRKCVAP